MSGSISGTSSSTSTRSLATDTSTAATDVLTPGETLDIEQSWGWTSAQDGASASSRIDFASFTADDLVAWAATQLRSIDTQMHDLVTRVQANSTRSALFSQVTSIVNSFQAAHPASNTSDTTQLDMDHETHLFTMPDGTTQTITLQAALMQAGYNVTTLDPNYAGSGVGNLVQSLQTFGSSMTDDSEQLSMSLQSLASRRSQITQMASQLIGSLNDTASKVVGNIH